MRGELARLISALGRRDGDSGRLETDIDSSSLGWACIIHMHHSHLISLRATSFILVYMQVWQEIAAVTGDITFTRHAYSRSTSKVDITVQHYS
jgi:hypothetical protein